MSSVGPVNPDNFLPGEAEEKGEKSSKVSKVAKKRIKSHEVEEVKSRPKLTRQVSVPDLKKKRQEKTELEDTIQKSGVLWQCMGRRRDKFGGHIYLFKLKVEYDGLSPDPEVKLRAKAAEDKIHEIFPAVEPSAENFLELKELAESAGLGKLGYSFEQITNGEDPGIGFYMCLPDKEAIQARWKKLFENNPHLTHPPYELDILESEDIADDMAYVLAFFTHDVLLSSGKEFVHDHLSHVMPILATILASEQSDIPTHRKEKARLVKLVSKGYRRILLAKRLIDEGKIQLRPEQRDLFNAHFEKLKTGLGALVDTLAAAPPGNEFTMKKVGKEFLNEHFKAIWSENLWPKFFERRFDVKTTDYDALVKDLTEVWELITEIEKEFDKMHPKTVRAKGTLRRE